MAPPRTHPQEPEEAFVRVTLKDVYAEVKQMRAEMASFIPQVPDHENRIRTVERWSYALPPTFILALISVLVAWRKA